MENKLEIISIGDVKFRILVPDLLPKVTAEEYQRLSDSIASEGIHIPIITDEDRGVIDGVNRLKSAQDLGLKKILFHILPGLSEAAKKQLAIKLNYQRRHMTTDERLGLATELRKDGLSYRQIAEILNIGHATVSRILGTVPDETADFPDKIIGKDGKKHPAKKPKPKKCIIAKNLTEAKRAFDACNLMDSSKLPNSTIDTKRAERIGRKVEIDRKRSQEYEDFKVQQAELLLGDFRIKGQEIESESVDMIFTDPPYDKATLPIWNDLGEFANRVLKPGGLLLSYSGTMYLPQVYEMLGNHLEYFWTFAIKHSGNNTYVPKVNVHQAWKPVVGYCKPPFNKYWKSFRDMVEGQQSKDHHEWEQSEVEAAHYIKALCPKNGILLDPMMGSGTTLVAGINLGLKCIGVEIDKAAYSTAEQRIKKTLKDLAEDAERDVA